MSEPQTFVDFQAFVQQVLVPTVQKRGVHTIALILPRVLAARTGAVPDWKLTFQVYWLPKNASWLDQIEIWFSVLQYKLLQPNHFRSTDELDQAILDFISYVIRPPSQSSGHIPSTNWNANSE